ncbi:unnamed protein product [Meloidogyne enterolobii]|uniref:Uncharacterized protein n=1 Tax=Meloidogyne enterolobii TaxID=390850 RepID=A0ACB0ZM28_MELEN
MEENCKGMCPDRSKLYCDTYQSYIHQILLNIRHTSIISMWNDRIIEMNNRNKLVHGITDICNELAITFIKNE